MGVLGSTGVNDIDTPGIKHVKTKKITRDRMGFVFIGLSVNKKTAYPQNSEQAAF